MSRTLRAREKRAWRDFKPRKYRKVDEVCLKKRFYADEISARAGALTSIEEYGNVRTLWVYRCPTCSGWHLTKSNHGKRFEVDRSDLFAGTQRKAA